MDKLVIAMYRLRPIQKHAQKLEELEVRLAVGKIKGFLYQN